MKRTIFIKVKLLIWLAVLLFCLLCAFGVLPISPPLWTTWLAAGCASLSAIIDRIEQKKNVKNKIGRHIIALGCLIPLLAIGLRASEAATPSPMGGADWLVIILLYLTLAVSVVFGFIQKEP